jgi:hypothetical protein
MKKTVLALAALALVALPMLAQADGFFSITGTVAKVSCTELPSLTPPAPKQCALAIQPDPGLTKNIEILCLDPDIADACSSFQPGDPVIAYGHLEKSSKVVDKIGWWTQTAF